MCFCRKGPVRIGDTVTAEAGVDEVDEARGGVRLDGRCVSHDGGKALAAEIRGFPGRFADWHPTVARPLASLRLWCTIGHTLA